MNTFLKNRLKEFRKNITAKKYDGFLIYNRANTYYYTGFGGSSSYTLITKGINYFITDFRYIEYAKNNINGFKIIRQSNDVLNDIMAIIKKEKIKRLGIETDLPINVFLKMQKMFSKIRLIPDEKIVREQRIIKDESEIKNIKRAAKITDKVLSEIKSTIKNGMKERDVVRHIKWLSDELGSEKEAFSPIVATGSNSALPHHQSSNKKIKIGDSIIVDLGCVFNSYHSDMTRTFFMNKVSEKMKKIYNIVFQAQKSAIKEVKAGKKCAEIDKIARDIISSYGYGKYFGHGLGHGVGLEVHEPPYLNPTSKYILKKGMIITVEPGIYIPEYGGVRIEDLVLVTKNGAKILSKTSKSLTVI